MAVRPLERSHSLGCGYAHDPKHRPGGTPTAITLDHTIVPSHDKDEAARFFARMFDLPYDGAGYFAPVRVNKELTLDFASARTSFNTPLW